MRVLFSLPVSLGALLGCAHALPPPQTPCPAAPSPVVAVEPQVVTAPAPELYALRWKLRLSDKVEWSPVTAALHTFSLPRWECALGEVQTDDVRAEGALQIRRARRLACTHVTGVTVQTKLACQVDEASTIVPDARELELALDAVPAVRIGCEPVKVERLELSAGKQSLGAVCVTPGGIAECAGSASTPP
jgi:hypothetical protein